MTMTSKVLPCSGNDGMMVSHGAPPEGSKLSSYLGVQSTWGHFSIFLTAFVFEPL